MRVLLNGQTLIAAREPERTRLLVLVSAWWTISHMENTGVSFDEFLKAAKEREAGALWDELTKRLHALTVDALGQWPEAVLTVATGEKGTHFHRNHRGPGTTRCRDADLGVEPFVLSRR